MSGLKLIDLINEESIKKMDKEMLLKKLKISLINMFVNTDLNILLDSFYSEYPNAETKKYFEDFSYGPDVSDIDKNQFVSIMNSSEMTSFLNNQLESPSIKNLLSKIKSDGTVEIYRSITVDRDWFDNLKNKKIKRLGVYWSWKEGNSVYGRNRDYKVELFSKIDEKYINWTQTIIQNIFYGDVEDEITLFKNTPIRLSKILYKKSIENRWDLNYSEINPTYFKNDIFYS